MKAARLEFLAALDGVDAADLSVWDHDPCAGAGQEPVGRLAAASGPLVEDAMMALLAAGTSRLHPLYVVSPGANLNPTASPSNSETLPY